MIEKLFSYNGNEVTFKNENGIVYVNATEMAKPFGKTPKDYLRTQPANELIVALTARHKCLAADLLMVKNGIGTWMHEDVALDFAKWLSVDFRLWCNDRIKELINVGFTATPQKLDDLLNNPDLIIGLANQVKELRSKNQQAENIISLQTPKVLFADAVSASKTTILIGEMAKILKQNGVNIGQNRLFEWMRNNGYLISRKGTDHNMPTQRSMELSLFQIKETTINHSDGHVSVSKTVKITGKGQLYFIDKFLGEKSIIPQKNLINQLYKF